MYDFSLYILDLAQNCIAAKATQIDITIHEMITNNKLFIEIADNGVGIPKDKLLLVTDPFYTTRTTRSVGLGLSLFKEMVTKANGELKIISNQYGTTVRALMQYDHIDLMDIGNIEDTVFCLILNENIEVCFEYLVDDSRYVFDTVEIKKVLKDIKITEPSIYAWLKEQFLKEINIIRRKK